MYTQKIFQAGNSAVVAIPKHLLKELGLKPGQKVTITKATDNSLLVEKPTATPTKKISAKKEHKEWLEVFMKENEEILDELAKH